LDGYEKEVLSLTGILETAKSLEWDFMEYDADWMLGRLVIFLVKCRIELD
jgi:hypothetical protein